MHCAEPGDWGHPGRASSHGKGGGVGTQHSVTAGGRRDQLSPAARQISRRPRSAPSCHTQRPRPQPDKPCCHGCAYAPRPISRGRITCNHRPQKAPPHQPTSALRLYLSALALSQRHPKQTAHQTPAAHGPPAPNKKLRPLCSREHGWIPR